MKRLMIMYSKQGTSDHFLKLDIIDLKSGKYLIQLKNADFTRSYKIANK